MAWQSPVHEYWPETSHVPGLPHSAHARTIAARAPHQIWTDYDARVVVFEALGRIDAAHLTETGGVARPQRGRRRAADGPCALEIPGPLMQNAIRIRHCPGAPGGAT